MSHTRLINNLKTFSNSFISGAKPELPLLFLEYDPEFEHHYFQVSINHDDKIKAVIDEILEKTGVEPRKKSRFFAANISVYAFLQEFKQIHSDNDMIKAQTEAMIEQIDQQQLYRVGFLSLSVISLTAFAGAGISYFFSESKLLEIIAGSLFFPVVGLIVTLIVTAYNFYKTQKESKHFWEMFHDYFFLISNASLNLVAYVLILTAAAAFSEIIPPLFIIAACINALKEVSFLVQHYREHHDHENNPNDPLETQQVSVRIQMDFIKHRNNLIIDICYALLMTAVVSVCVFMPSGLGVLALFLGAIFTLTLLHKACMMINEMYVQNKMNQRFETIESNEEIKLSDHSMFKKPSSGESNQAVSDEPIDGMLLN